MYVYTYYIRIHTYTHTHIESSIWSMLLYIVENYPQHGRRENPLVGGCSLQFFEKYLVLTM